MIYEDDELIDENGQEQDAVTTRTSSGGTLALALLAGAAIGAAVALMMAPRTGQDMRRVLRKRAEGLRDTAGGVLDETTEDARWSGWAEPARSPIPNAARPCHGIAPRSALGAVGQRNFANSRSHCCL
jgi:hypothetical protein